MTDKHAGFVARTKEVATNVSWTHCCVHRQALASKRMPQGLKELIDNAIHIGTCGTPCVGTDRIPS
jgi:hypothetical protein